LRMAADPEADAEAAAPVEDAEALLPPELPVVVAAALVEAEPELAAVEDAADEEELLSPEDAFAIPQVTLRQAVWPVRSFGCAATQSVFHCAQTKDGMVWS